MDRRLQKGGRTPPVVGRLAPSPTGGLHLGHARTFLIAWLAARSQGGSILLRIEDIDASRVRPEAARTAIDDLRWLGLDWDGEPYVQSSRMGTYRDAVERLKRDDSIYPCTCTRADIARAASAPHAEDEGPTYPGTCSGRSAADAEAIGDRPFAWRFRVPPGPVGWADLFRGQMAIDPGRVGGDFLVARHPFAPSYQLAVVVDDAAMGIDQVIRGDDLIPSTPRQILLDRALDGGRPSVLTATSRSWSDRTGSGWPNATDRSSWPRSERRASTPGGSSAGSPIPAVGPAGSRMSGPSNSWPSTIRRPSLSAPADSTPRTCP